MNYSKILKKKTKTFHSRFKNIKEINKLRSRSPECFHKNSLTSFSHILDNSSSLAFLCVTQFRFFCKQVDRTSRFLKLEVCN